MDYVVEGQWDDVEWRAIAAQPLRSPADAVRVADGPRVHPFGPLAHAVPQEDGRVFIFPSEAAAASWAAEHHEASDEPQPEGHADNA